MNSFDRPVNAPVSIVGGRKSARRALLAVVSCLLLTVVVSAASAAPGTNTPAPSALQRSLDQVVAAGVPGIVVLARQGNHTTVLASGYGNLKQKTRTRPTDRFRVGSITKTFVATVVLQLVSEGKLSLDDTIQRRLPGVIPNGKSITIRELLNMTSGLFDYLNDGDNTIGDRLLKGDATYRWSPLELLAISNKHKPRFAPGTAWEYCSTCYVVLGLIVEKTTGHTLRAELKRRVFVPAGLNATSFDTEPQIRGQYAHGYESLGKPAPSDVSVLSPSHGWAAGALVSNVQDLARFYRALYRGQLISPALVKQMQTSVPHKTIGNWGYGLGLFKKPTRCGTAYGHPGGIPGYIAEAWSSKDGSRQAMVLTNLGEYSSTDKGEVARQRVLEDAYCMKTIR
jgi:D-alanyl-D-alanine carboxypeptidase